MGKAEIPIAKYNELAKQFYPVKYPLPQMSMTPEPVREGEFRLSASMLKTLSARLKSVRMIRLAVSTLFICASTAFAGNGGSAITAMQTVADQPAARNAAFIELRGERGDPMPSEWAVLLADPSARGGVREMTVADGQVTSERTPLAGYSDISSRPALDRSKVAVDAASVFDIAQREAVRSQLGFHWLEYTLATNPQTFQPEWTVRLHDNSGSLVGTLRIAATGGGILQPLEPGADVQLDKKTEKRVGGAIGKVVDFIETTAKKVQDTTLRTVGNVQEFLVGERTVGPKDE